MKSVAGIAMAVLAMSAVSASAQHNTWQSKCRTDQMTDKKNCSVDATIDPKQGVENMLIVGISTTPVGIVVVGSGHGARARIRIDENQAVTLSDCDSAGCILASAQATAAIRQMRNGTRMLVEYSDVRGRTIGPWEISLSGFDAEYRRSLSGGGAR
ncbi:invasion associated locus B family protein [Reyranella massiliensis]|uniref:invasion associated locus B family protein n=1 Tax=Reyranella massiliensis TaxID=445220 RepID=UPI000A0030F9|nr:invasion associated locus B family protein [Reyranella massiliensis]